MRLETLTLDFHVVFGQRALGYHPIVLGGPAKSPRDERICGL